MKITFLGTRGGIKAKSKEHNKHSITLITYKNKSILLDYGLDWLHNNPKVAKPEAIFITHGHPDHIGGLSAGAPCPVYATKESWQIMKNYPIEDKFIIKDREIIKIAGMQVEPFTVVHSIHAPAVGYKITAGKASIFYVPDLIGIKKESAALKNIKLYIGDGAIITREILMRHKDSQITGHAPISLQLSWCAQNKVPQAVFTHCGTEIVTGDKEIISNKIAQLAKEYNIKTSIAYDNLKIIIR